jgi:hypothetical protein
MKTDENRCHLKVYFDMQLINNKYSWHFYFQQMTHGFEKVSLMAFGSDEL